MIKRVGPPIGAYTLNYDLVRPNNFKVIPFKPDDINHGIIQKQENAIKHLKVCKHAMRLIEGWSSKKGESTSLKDATKR